MDPGRLALVAVGCQGWWADRTVDSDMTVGLVSALAPLVRNRGGSVVHIRTAGSPGSNGRPARGPAFGAPDWELMLRPEPGDLVIDTPGLNAFFGSSLDAQLRERRLDHLAVGGLGLETLIYSTVTGANDRGFECITLTDASAPHDPPVAERALCSITMSGGIFGAIGSITQLTKSLAS